MSEDSDHPQPVGEAGSARATEAGSAPAAPLVYVAGLWRRLLAGLVDSLCLAPVIAIIGWLALRSTGGQVPAVARLRVELVLEAFIDGGALFYGLLTLCVLLAVMYGFLFTATTGATPGMRLTGLRVIDVYGERPEWWRALARGLGIVLGAALLGLGLLWIGFDREKRGLHDWLAGTYVIRATRAEPAGIGAEAGQASGA